MVNHGEDERLVGVVELSAERHAGVGRIEQALDLGHQ